MATGQLIQLARVAFGESALRAEESAPWDREAAGVATGQLIQLARVAFGEAALRAEESAPWVWRGCVRG